MEWKQKILKSSAIGYILALLLPTSILAQTTFERTYGSDGYDEGNSVIQTTDLGYMIAGFTTESWSEIFSDVYLVKTDSWGNIQWTKVYRSPGGWDEAFCVVQTSDGGYVITGAVGPYVEDVYLLKANSYGDTLWTRRYGGSSFDEGRDVIQTTDGGYIVAGYTESYGAGFRDVYLIKTDSLGKVLWTKTYGDTNSEVGSSVLQTQDGGYAIAGWKWFPHSNEIKVYFIKTDPFGDTLWTRTYGGGPGNSITRASDDGYLIVGKTITPGGGNVDVYLLKTDSHGDTLWTKRYGGIAVDEGSSVAQTSDGGYIITGSTWSYGAGRKEVYLLKTDSLGDTLWTRTYGGASDEEGHAVAQTNDGGYVITGFTYSYGEGLSDVYLIKTDTLGNVSGVNESGGYVFLKMFSLLQNWPNPFNSATTIRYTIPQVIGERFKVKGGPNTYNLIPITLKVYNILGEEVRILVDERQRAGYYRVVWDGRDSRGKPVASGVYLARLKVIGERLKVVKTRKMVLLR